MYNKQKQRERQTLGIATHDNATQRRTKLNCAKQDQVNIQQSKTKQMKVKQTETKQRNEDTQRKTKQRNSKQIRQRQISEPTYSNAEKKDNTDKLATLHE